MNLGKVAEAYKAALPAGELAEFGISDLDHLGVPVWTAALWPENGPFCNGVGYGATEEAARTSAYGECVESAGAWRTMKEIPRTRASYKELVGQYGASSVMDPVTGCLPAGSPYTPDTELEWVEARRHPGGEVVLVPVEFVATRGADLAGYEPKLFTPITNGLGAGLDLERALTHGILELLQRDGNGLAFRALDRGVVLDLDGVEDEETNAILAHLDSEGVEVKAKLAATDFGMANLYVVGEDPDPSRVRHHFTVSACGEACHPDRERALKKSLLEFCASRARKPFNHGPLGPIEEISPPGYVGRFREKPLGSEEDRSLEDILGWLSMPHDELRSLLSAPFSEKKRVPFTSLPTASGLEDPEDPADLLEGLTRRLSDEDFEILYVDVSPPNDLGVRAAKAIVPGLEVETMSYGRIGARNVRRLLDRDLGLVGIGEPPTDRPQARHVLLAEEQEVGLGGSAWFDYEAADHIVGPLYPLYREPGRHVVALEAERRGIRGVRE
ncbi:MAG: YcaO-like family protein [Rubrobacteraceae bacterium]